MAAFPANIFALMVTPWDRADGTRRGRTENGKPWVRRFTTVTTFNWIVTAKYLLDNTDRDAVLQHHEQNHSDSFSWTYQSGAGAITMRYMAPPRTSQISEDGTPLPTTHTYVELDLVSA